MRSPLLLFFAVFALVGCGPNPPCDAAAGGCAPVAGTYVLSRGSLACSAWQSANPLTGQLVVTQVDGGNALTLTLWPGTVLPHRFTGTLNVGATFTANEPAQNALASLPVGNLNGSFVGAAAPYTLAASLTFFSGATVADGGAQCGTGAQLEAVEQ